MSPQQLALYPVPLALDIVFYGDPLDRETLSLLYAEILQDRGAIDEAAAALARLPETYATCLARAELAAEAGDADLVLVLAGGANGRDDLSAGLQVFEGWAQRRLGATDAARTARASTW